MLNLIKDSCPLPTGYLLEIARHCPRALETYIRLWEDKNDQDTIVVHEDEIESKYFKSKRPFQTDLRLLSREGLISVIEKPNSYEIEMLNWEEKHFEAYA